MVTYSIVWRNWHESCTYEQSCNDENVARELRAKLLSAGFEPIVRLYVNGKRNYSFTGF